MLANLRISRPTLYLCAAIFFIQSIHGFTVARRGNDLTTLDPWYAVALFWAIGWWFLNDHRNYATTWANGLLDMGLFLYVAWVFVLPYYLFKSRGWRAIDTVLLLLGVYLVASIVGALVYLVSAV